ncbi:MAG TPA: O-antigen ligase family protein [Solirubrobacteraceae bacterium]
MATQGARSATSVISRRLSSLISPVVLIVVAALAGLAAGLLSPLVTVCLGVVGLVVLMVLWIRAALPWARRKDQTGSTGSDPDAPPERAELRLARLVFYLGTLTLGQSALRFAAGLTVSEFLFFGALALCVLAGLRGEGFTGVPSPIAVAVGIFVLGGALSSFDAQSPGGSAYQVMHALYVLLLWPCVGAMVLRSRGQLVAAIGLWSLSAALDGLDALAQLVGLHVLGPVRQGNRMTGLTENPNDLGGVTSIALVPALFIATDKTAGRSPSRQALWWAIVALVGTGLVLSGSVAGMAAAAGALLIWLSSPLVRASARIAVLATAVCALAVVVAAGTRISSPIQRVTQVTSPASAGNNGSGQDRISVAEQAWPRIKRDPVVGTGLDVNDSDVTIISHAYSVPYQIHGLPLAAWYETGLFGLIGLLGLIGVLAVLGWRGVAAARDEDDALVGWALLAALIAFVIEAMTQPLVFQQYGWVTGVMLVAWLYQPRPLQIPETAPAIDRTAAAHLRPLWPSALPGGGSRSTDPAAARWNAW